MPTVLLLPDSALLVPGAGGALADPLAEARSAALRVLRAVPRRAGVLVIAPGRSSRLLTGPFGDGLAAAGIDLSRPVRSPGGGDAGDVRSSGGGAVGAVRSPGGAVPGVGAAAALALLRAAGHDPDRTTTVVEVAPSGTTASPAVAADLIVVVGSLSARHGPDAPLPEDPAAIAADVALLTAFAAGPRALAEVFGDLHLPECDRLAITGGRPWRTLLSLLAAGGPVPDGRAELLWSGTPGGAQHALARWEVPA